MKTCEWLVSVSEPEQHGTWIVQDWGKCDRIAHFDGDGHPLCADHYDLWCRGAKMFPEAGQSIGAGL